MSEISATRRLSALNQASAPPLASLLALRLACTLMIWDQRRKTRRALRKLDAAALKDIGMTEGTAHREAIKPFWEA